MPSRRAQIELSDAEIRDYLKSSRTMILVSNGKDGFPHPMPMWYAVDDDGSVRMTTFRKSQKIANLRRDPRVSLLVESGEEYAQLKGVVIYGEAEFVEDADFIRETLARAGNQDVTPVDPKLLKAMEGFFAKQVPKRIGLRIHPKRILSWDHAKLGSGVY